jgi:uncharacterized membrane protein YhaH (DUF805 family)
MSANAIPALLAHEQKYYVPRVFSMRGRIGRLHLLICDSVLLILAGLAIPLLCNSVGLDMNFRTPVFLYLALPLVICQLIMAKRRFNDLNWSGWWSILLMLPVLNLVFSILLVSQRGSTDANNYGLAPTRTSLPLKIAGVIFMAGLIAFYASAKPA